MRTIEIARQFAALGSQTEACKAYMLVIHEGGSPAAEMEAAVYLLETGGNYKAAYSSFRNLYHRGCFREDCLAIMTQAFYMPNRKAAQRQYERNCKLLKKYPYLFRKDFLPFEELPIRFYPFDDEGYIPFYPDEERFGDYINFNNPVVSQNFFKDLEKPILAADVYSQYKLEYLIDNVRKSEYVSRDNHIYLHYTSWGEFCAHLQCLDFHRILWDRKPVFLIGEEIRQYLVDFKARFGIDYSAYPLKPVGIREINRLIWHTQLSIHNGGDFFNEIFDAHPNLVADTSLLFDNLSDVIRQIEQILRETKGVPAVVKRFYKWEPSIIAELYLLNNRTEKDILAAKFLNDTKMIEKENRRWLDDSSCIAPAVFIQPHFHNIDYSIYVDQRDRSTLFSKQYAEIQNSNIFKRFKYIKTFTPMRRITTGATVRFACAWARKNDSIAGDFISQRILNRRFMIDWQNRLFKDSVLVRFEDGKLNPKATFTALAAFLDVPYAESMEYCSYQSKNVPYLGGEGYAPGFNPETIYRTYDEYVNDSERYFLEYFLRDAYKCYGYGFHYYDGAEVDLERAKELIAEFTNNRSLYAGKPHIERYAPRSGRSRSY